MNTKSIMDTLICHWPLLPSYTTLAITCHCVFRWPRSEFQAEPRTKRQSQCQAAQPMLVRPRAVDRLLLPQWPHLPPRPPHPSAPMSLQISPHPRRPGRTPILTRLARPPSGNTGNWQSTSKLLKWQTENLYTHSPSLLITVRGERAIWNQTFHSKNKMQLSVFMVREFYLTLAPN